MNDRRFVGRRQMTRQPVDQLLHLLDAARLRKTVLLRPASDLALDVSAFLAKAAEADGPVVGRVQLRDGGVHGVVNGAALGGREIGQAPVPEDAAVGEVHDKKRRADDGLVRAEKTRLRHWKAGRAEGAHHLVFALDRVRGREKLPRRLSAQHIFLRRRFEQIGRVRLPAFELLDAQRPGEASDLAREIVFEPPQIEPQRFTTSFVPE